MSPCGTNITSVVDLKRGSESKSRPREWSREKEKAFENVIVLVDLVEDEAVWNKIEGLVREKTAEELKRHNELLVKDVGTIEGG